MHWHERANEMSVLAAQMNDDQSKEALLRIAAEYEKLARRALERAASSTPTS
jgi:hypothetical protein